MAPPGTWKDFPDREAATEIPPGEKTGGRRKKMNLKEKSSAAGRTYLERVREDAGKAVGRVSSWVGEPDSPKESGVRVLWILGACVLWVLCVRYSPLFTLAVTPAVLLVISARLGRRAPAAEAPVREPGDREFWDKHIPAEEPPVVAVSDEDERGTPAVQFFPESGKAPQEDENPQVSESLDTWTPDGTPGSEGLVTGYDSHVDHEGIFPVTSECPEGQVDLSKPQVSGVSKPLDTSTDQATEDVTESEIGTDDDEEDSSDFADRLLKLSDNGLSVREIAQETGRKRSTVGAVLKKARERRDLMEMASAAMRARPPEDGLTEQLVLPGSWYGEDGHAQEVRFTGDAVSISGARTREDSVSAMEFIRQAFLGKTETTTGNWMVSLNGGTISGSAPEHHAEFHGFWSESGTVVISRVSLA
jgi:hypothetical protein